MVQTTTILQHNPNPISITPKNEYLTIEKEAMCSRYEYWLLDSTEPYQFIENLLETTKGVAHIKRKISFSGLSIILKIEKTLDNSIGIVITTNNTILCVARLMLTEDTTVLLLNKDSDPNGVILLEILLGTSLDIAL